MDSFKNEETKIVIKKEGLEATRNHNEVLINGSEPIKNSLATNAEIRSDLATLNNVQQRIRSAINAPKVDNSPYSATFRRRTEEQLQLQKNNIQINLYRTRRLSRGRDVIPGWELLHPDDRYVNAVHFHEQPSDNMETNDLKGHLIKVRVGDNNNVFSEITNVIRQQ